MASRRWRGAILESGRCRSELHPRGSLASPRVSAFVASETLCECPSKADFHLIVQATSANLPRSRSSPSPPSSTQASGRGDSVRRVTQSSRTVRKRPTILVNTPGVAVKTSSSLDWSTSYHAGSSSAASPRESDTDDETEDEGPIHFRGRAFSHSRQTTAHPPLKRTSISRLNGSPEGGPPRAPEGPVPFTRSRSPAVMRSTPVSGKANPLQQHITLLSL
ncbi:hypothetical protein EV421DRAFT_1899611 [Armillaria borealis]|uniref:Uncharacterized protein n=1 Tax=Armillaria borealis TaxID=47425 RepID=A0AA39MY26_9AGAR|nr:hypothetical protein EV421DRAFT_1899611 [Armillaria borealis]